MALSLSTVDGRTICQVCGGWAEISSVAAEFAAIHSHPTGSPVVYRLTTKPSLWSVPGLLATAPLGSQLVAFIGQKTIREARRIVVSTPEELRASI